MTLLAWLFDLLLGLALIWLGVWSVSGRDAYDAVMAFIGLGLLMALAWLRLGAPDIALAEAALGGGITGALLLGALKRSADEKRDPDEKP